MAHEEMLAELDRRRAEAARMGGQSKLEKRHARGQLNAEERMRALVDDGSFLGSRAARRVRGVSTPTSPTRRATAS